jgi:iron(III) transport system permease protein
MSTAELGNPPSTENWLGRIFDRRRAAGAVAVIFVIAVAALAVAPLFSLGQIALKGDADIWEHLAAYVIPAALTETALLLGGVALITATAGAITAWLVTTFQFPGRNALIWLLPLPLAIPTYIAAYVYADLLDTLGPVQSALRVMFGWRTPADYWFPEVRSLGGAIFVFGLVLYPYVYLATRAMLQTQCAVFADAARTLGARPWMVARDITLPLARPALAVGLALALLETLNDIGASEYLGVHTLTLSIFTTWLNRGSLSGAAQIAAVMLLAVVALIALERYGRRRQSYFTQAQDSQIALRVALTGYRQWLATVACFLPVLFGFLIPAGFLVRETIRRGLLAGFDPALVRHAVATVLLAGAATAIAIALGFCAVIIARLMRRQFLAWLVSLSGIGYAIPGTVLALGLLSPLVAVDETINWLTRIFVGINVGLIVAGSGAAVVIAYVVRFLAIAIGLTQAGLTRVPVHFEDIARLLGAKPRTVARTIHLPLVRSSLWGAALLIFVDCLKELPATLLLRPLNVETLSTYIYQFATRGSFEEGALAALLIVAAGILPVIFIIRSTDLAQAPERRSSLA